MLHRLKVENFFSIRDPLTIDFSVAANVPASEVQFSRPIENEKRVPRVIAFFGPNAVGKSTVLRALAFVDLFIEKSADRPVDSSPFVVPFLETDNFEKPTKLTLEFSSSHLFDNMMYLYRYEVHLANIGSHGAVLYEALSYKPAKKFVRIFERVNDEIKPSKVFQLPENDPRRTTLNTFGSAVGALAKFNHKMARSVQEMFSLLILSNIEVAGLKKFTAENTSEFYKSCGRHFDRLCEFINSVDLGIEKIQLLEGKSDKKIEPHFKHRGLSLPLPLIYESEGTQHIYKMFPVVSLALSAGGVAVIDELDSNVHPYVLSEIVRMFRDNSINKNHAQLLFTCHNATILEQLSKEEVFVVEKDRSGCTSAYSFKDVEGLRRDANLYQKYMSGAVGGIPTLG